MKRQEASEEWQPMKRQEAFLEASPAAASTSDGASLLAGLLNRPVSRRETARPEAFVPPPARFEAGAIIKVDVNYARDYYRGRRDYLDPYSRLCGICGRPDCGEPR